MINLNFSEDIDLIFSGLKSLQRHLEEELNQINNRIDYLDAKQCKDDEFFKDLQALIQKRNML